MRDGHSKLMILGEQGMLGLDQSLIPEFIKRFRTDAQLPKKVHELLVGYIFLQFVDSAQRDSAVIGFPAKDGWREHCPKDGLTVDYLLDHSDTFVRDMDADIHISSGGLVIRCQITRFVFPSGQEPCRGLAALIAHKCQHQQADDQLNLVVSIEKTPKVTEVELRTLVQGSLEVPFASITLLSKASDRPGHFGLIQLYPNVTGKEIETGLPI